MNAHRDDNRPIYFDATKFGRELKEISADLIISESNKVESRWFHSKNDMDLFLWLDKEQNLIKQQFCYFGQVVEWNIIEGLKTGLVIADVNEYGEEVDVGSPLVQYDDEPHKFCVGQTVEIISEMTELEEDIKKDVLNNFMNSPSVDNIDPEEFLLRYGASRRAPSNFKTGLVRLVLFFKRLFRV